MAKANHIFSCRFRGCNYTAVMKAHLTYHQKGHAKLFRKHNDVNCPIAICQWQGKHGSLRRHKK